MTRPAGGKTNQQYAWMGGIRFHTRELNRPGEYGDSHGRNGSFIEPSLRRVLEGIGELRIGGDRAVGECFEEGDERGLLVLC